MQDSDTKKLLACIMAADRGSANALVDQWAKDRSYSEALKILLEPAVREFGIMWSGDDNISLAQGYIAGKIAEDIVNKAFAEHPPQQKETSDYSVVLGNIEDDYHPLGRRLLASFLAMNGWNVIDLGNDTLAGDFVDAAIENHARVIGVSAMMYDHALNIIKVREELNRRALNGKIQLAVGGAVFNEHLVLVEKVGGDGSAPNAIDAIELFENLRSRSLKFG